MRIFLLPKYQLIRIRQYIFIILTATIFFFNSTKESFSSENVFIIENIEIKGVIDKNFSRNKFINKAFKVSFKKLLSKILISRDLDKIDDLNLNQIKNLIDSFQIFDERHIKEDYSAKFKIFYNDKSVKNLLRNKNISFSEPKNITIVFFPILFIDDDIKIFTENFLYENFKKINLKNDLINFVLPLEDIEDIDLVNTIKNEMENLDAENIVNKYDIENYAIVIMQYNNKTLETYLKTRFNSNIYNKNFSYKLDSFKNEKKLDFITDNLKLRIIDTWKEANIVNLNLPLTIHLKFYYEHPKDFYILEKSINKIHIIDSYQVEEFNLQNTMFKINYFGNPKNLQDEFLKMDYKLENSKGIWNIYKNE